MTNKIVWYVQIEGGYPDNTHGEVYAANRKDAVNKMREMAEKDRKRYEELYPEKDIRITIYPNGSQGWVWGNHVFNCATGEYDDEMYVSYKLRWKKVPV